MGSRLVLEKTDRNVPKRDLGGHGLVIDCKEDWRSGGWCVVLVLWTARVVSTYSKATRAIALAYWTQKEEENVREK